jgi:hypothetical protein
MANAARGHAIWFIVSQKFFRVYATFVALEQMISANRT